MRRRPMTPLLTCLTIEEKSSWLADDFKEFFNRFTGEDVRLYEFCHRNTNKAFLSYALPTYLHTLTSYNSICCNACQSCPLRLPSLVPPHLDSVLSYYIVWLICCKILKNTEKHRKQSLGSGQVLPVLSHAQLSQKSSPVVLCAKAAAAHSANFNKKVHKPQSYQSLAVTRVKKANQQKNKKLLGI